MNATDRYVAAQTRLLGARGVDATSRFLELPWRGHRTLVLQGENNDRTSDPLVFVRGGGRFAAIWAPLLAPLGPYPLFAVDRPGIGSTDPIDQRPGTLGSVLTVSGPRKGASVTGDALRRMSQPSRLIWAKDEPFGSVETGNRAAGCLAAEE